MRLEMRCRLGNRRRFRLRTVPVQVGPHAPPWASLTSRPCIILSSPNIFLSVAMGLDSEVPSQEHHR
jgi:hypothetical protein